MTRYEREIARRLSAVEKKIAGAAASAQAAHTSIEGGAIRSYDHDGNLRLRIGDQGDGTQTITVVDGPVPPAPSAPVVAVDGPVLTISWDGHLADPNAGLPADFARIHVHLSQTPDMSSAPVRASIEARAGASTVTAVETAGTWWVALAVEAQSGKRSPLSAPVEAVVSLVDLDGALDAVRESADGKNRNYYNPVKPSPGEHEPAEGDLWFDTSEDGQNLPHRWDGTRWVSVADQRVEAVRTAMESMRGDLEGQIEGAAGNRITWSPATPPSGAAPGKAGDTWFQIQAGRVTGQWAHDGSSWVARPISHEVIASLDLGKATVGELDGARIKAGSVLADAVLVPGSAGSTVIADGAVTTEKLAAGAITAESGVIGSLDLGKATVGELDGARIAFRSASGEILKLDALDGKVITGTVVQTARSGARVVLGDTGLSVYDAADDWRVRLTPGGSMFKGDLEAESLVATGPAELRHGANRMTSGAELTLAAGVGDPNSPPTVQPFWQSTPVAFPAGREAYGLAWAGGKFWTYLDTPTSTENDELVSFHSSTGAVIDRIPMTDEFWAAGGVTAIGDRLYLLGPKTSVAYKYFVRVYTIAGQLVREWEYKEVGWGPKNPLGYKPGIGTDGTNVVIAHCSDAGSLIWRTYTPEGAYLSTVDCRDGTKSDISGVYVGPADWGGGSFVTIVKDRNRRFETFTTAGVWQQEKSWLMADDQPETGLVFVDGSFRSVSRQVGADASAGRVTRYEDRSMGDNSADWWAVYRWAHDLNGDATIDLWSRISPARRFTWPARSRLRVMGDPLPESVGFIAPALAKQQTTPARTDFRATDWWPIEGKPHAEYRELPADWRSKPVPQDLNSFPDADPAVLRTGNDRFVVRGDGSGQWGPLSFNSAGSVTGVPVVAIGYLPIEVTAANSIQSVTVTLPAGKFSRAPIVVLSVTSFDPRQYRFTVNALSESSFEIRVSRDRTGTMWVNWIAVEEG